jgi:hypothetical protein
VRFRYASSGEEAWDVARRRRARLPARGESARLSFSAMAYGCGLTGWCSSPIRASRDGTGSREPLGAATAEPPASRTRRDHPAFPRSLSSPCSPRVPLAHPWNIIEATYRDLADQEAYRAM